MHLVFGCCITASGSLTHCEHTPWPLLLQILGAVLEFLISPYWGLTPCPSGAWFVSLFVFGCCITASGSLTHCEHTPWPLLLQILGAVLEFLISPYWGLTPCPSGAWFVSLFVLFLGNPGFTAGRGFNPAGGAAGDVAPAVFFRISSTDFPLLSASSVLSASTLLVNTLGWSRVCTEILRYSMFGCLKPVGSFNVCTDIAPVGSVLGVFSIPRRVVDNVSYRIQILDSAPTDFVPSSPHQSSTSTSSMNFTDEILQGTTTVVGSTPNIAQFSLPPVVSDSFNDLRTSISRIISIQSKESRRLDDSHSEVLDKIKQLETTILDAFYQQNQTFHRLITGIHQADARKEAKEQKAIIEDMDERLATLRSEQLDFRAQSQENYNNLSSQLGELVAYINRGNDKNGEECSSRRPQPPSDDLNRPSGGNASRGGGGGGSSGSGRRDDRKGSSTKKGSGSSGAGGPYKKNVNGGYMGKVSFKFSLFQFLYKLLYIVQL
ncbi:hypothetical protein F511_42369 [Dorcoceras hygrometricum]|uniref:Uncharacterized protein n=1 Tax=Dorcoceras hygrometricum TaxID=472368 RepID=A0A2Z7BCT5_9LAMI|nr:hypothetical protein F511_42369 [Dorcoceras hygrometricum]